tara:strand:+ start:457 stop:1140 length:684 start_codon:yes stop_codon:yes gene_type:complete
MHSGIINEIAKGIIAKVWENGGPASDGFGSFWEFFGEEAYEEIRNEGWPEELTQLEISVISYRMWSSLDYRFGKYYEWYMILYDLCRDPIFGHVLLDAYGSVLGDYSENAGMYDVANEAWHEFLSEGHFPEKTELLLIDRWVVAFSDEGIYTDGPNEGRFDSHEDFLDYFIYEIGVYGREKVLERVRHELFLASAGRFYFDGEEIRREVRDEEREMALDELQNLLDA